MTTKELTEAQEKLITYTKSFLKKTNETERKHMQFLAAGVVMSSVSNKFDFFCEPENLKSLTHISIDELRELTVLMNKFLKLETDIAVINILLENIEEPEKQQ